MKKRIFALGMLISAFSTLLLGCDAITNRLSEENEGGVSTEAAVSFGGNTSTTETSARLERDNEQEGAYRVLSINNESVRDYFEALAAKKGTDAKSMLAELGVEDIDALADKLGFTLNSDGSAVFGILGTSGVETREGLWSKKGNGVVLTIFDAEQISAQGENDGQSVSYRDEILDCKFEKGVITSRKGPNGVSWVYCKAETAENAAQSEAGAVDINIGSMAGVYQIKEIDGKDAKAYYLEKYPEQSGLEAQMKLMAITSIDTLQEEMCFTLHADGTVSFAKTPENYEPQSGSWTQEADRVTVRLVNPSVPAEYGLMAFGGSAMQYGNGTIQYTVRNGALALEERSGESCVFARIGDE